MVSMFESKVYECMTCHEFFFFELDADEHKKRVGHSDFKNTNWTQPTSPPRINRKSGSPI